MFIKLTKTITLIAAALMMTTIVAASDTVEGIVKDAQVLYNYCRSSDHGRKPRASCTVAVKVSEVSLSRDDDYVLLSGGAARFRKADGSYQNHASVEFAYDNNGRPTSMSYRESCSRARSYRRSKTCTVRSLIAAVAVPSDKYEQAKDFIDKGELSLQCRIEENGAILVCNLKSKKYRSKAIRGDRVSNDPTKVMTKVSQ